MSDKKFKLRKTRAKQRNLSPYFQISTIVFAIAILMGYFTAINSPQETQLIIEQFFEDLAFTDDLSPFLIFLFILLNNTVKAFVVIATGFLFGIIPLLFIFSNGEIIGLVIGFIQMKQSILFAIFGLLPHGILEVPAIVMATGYGLWLGNAFYRKLRYSEALKPEFKFVMKKYLTVILPLLLGAALIEAFITPWILQFFF